MGYTQDLPDLEPQPRRDTFDGLLIQYTEGGAPVDLTNIDITCEFTKDDKSGGVMKTVSNIGNVVDGISKPDPANGWFRLLPFDADWDPGNYYFYFRFNNAGNKKKYIQGILPIVED